MREEKNSFSDAVDKFFVLHRKFFQRNTQELGLYIGQPPVLMYIREHPGCTQSDIAEALGVSAASIAFSTKRMQKSGCLLKQVNSLNLRCNKLYVTPEGEAILERFEEDFDKLNEKIFRGFTPEEIRQFHALIQRVNENLEQLTAGPAGTHEEFIE